MSERASIFSITQRALQHVIHQPILIVFGAIAMFGGVISVLGTVANESVNAILLLDGLHIIGLAFLQHVVAIALGAILSLLVILAISGFAQGILLKVAGAHFHKEEDPWYGALRRGFDSAIPLMVIWLVCYIVSALFIVGIYRLGIVVLSTVASTTASIWISILAIAIVAFLLISFATIAFYASCFVSIFRLKTWKSIGSGFDLFAQMPMRSIGFLFFLVVLWAVGILAISIVFGIILFVCVWLAHFGIGADRLTAFVYGGFTSNGLLIIILLGILFVTNAALTAFGNTAWALFFLEHVSTAQLPKKSVRHSDSLPSALPEAETA